jgi:dipeptidyl aminopeptidase/acylaminoacyl peptidase
MLTRLVVRLLVVMGLLCLAGVVGAAAFGQQLGGEIVTLVYQQGAQAGVIALDMRTEIRHPLTHEAANDARLAWSPDGTQFAYRAAETQLMVMHANGQPYFAIEYQDWGVTNPRWSPDKRWIAFEGTPADGMYDLFVTPADHSEPRNLTNTPLLLEEYPTWSPDGTALAYQLVDFSLGFRVDSVRHIELVKLDNTPPRRVFDAALFPAWLPDGKQIAYFQWQSARAVVLGELTTGIIRPIDQNTRSVPAIAPDGRAIAYLIVRPDKGLTLRLRVLEGDLYADYHLPFQKLTPFVWSPDGTALVFATPVHGNRYAVYRLDVATGALRHLLTSEDFTLPVWQPE